MISSETLARIAEQIVYAAIEYERACRAVDRAAQNSEITHSHYRNLEYERETLSDKLRDQVTAYVLTQKQGQEQYK